MLCFKRLRFNPLPNSQSFRVGHQRISRFVKAVHPMVDLRFDVHDVVEMVDS